MVAKIPIVRERRAPYRTRLRTSRLYGSVPNGCASDGGRSLSATMSGCAAGSYGAMKGASAPTSTITPSTNSAMREERLRRIPRTVSPSGDSRGCAPLVGAESWVGPGIKEVGEQASKSDHDAADDHATYNERVIARADGVDDGVAHSGPGEDPFDEERAGQKRRERETDQRDGRQQSAAQRMAPEYLTLRQTLEARRSDVVGG